MITKVIILEGNDNIGKTVTLKLVVRMLLDNKARLIAFSNNFAKWIIGGEVGDIWAIMEYAEGNIFITTRGDYPKCILDDFDCALQLPKLTLNEIDIFICAAHNIGQVEEVFRRKGLTLSNPIIVDKIKSSQTTLNVNDMDCANIIFNHI